MRERNFILRWVTAALTIGLCAAAAPNAAAREQVSIKTAYPPGTVVIVTHARELYYVLGPDQAIRYPVGVGRAGMAWHGHAYVARKLLHPAWQESRGKPVIPGGSPQNPMGVAALGLDHGNYAIHGTNNPASIGGFVSHGCIRMHNEDVMDLYQRVPVGAPVYVLQ